MKVTSVLTVICIGVSKTQLHSSSPVSSPSAVSYSDGGYYSYGSPSPAYYTDYSDLTEEGVAVDRQDLNPVALIGFFGRLGGLGIATVGFIFLSAVLGSLIAPIILGVFQRVTERIFEPGFQLPELPFRSLRFAEIDDRRSLASSLHPVSWILSSLADSGYRAEEQM